MGTRLNNEALSKLDPLNEEKTETDVVYLRMPTELIKAVQDVQKKHKIKSINKMFQHIVVKWLRDGGK